MTRRILFFVPARVGSKGVLNKNFRRFGGRSLVQLAVESAFKTRISGDVVVSVDGNFDRRAVEFPSLTRVVKRSPTLGLDEALVEGAVKEFLELQLGSGQRYDFVILLEPTSPFRTTKTLQDFIGTASRLSAHNLMTAQEVTGSIGNGRGGRFHPQSPHRRRQERESMLLETGVAYSQSADALLAGKAFVGSSTPYLIVDPLEGFDINTMLDFQMAETMYASLRTSAPQGERTVE